MVCLGESGTAQIGTQKFLTTHLPPYPAKSFPVTLCIRPPNWCREFSHPQLTRTKSLRINTPKDPHRLSSPTEP